MRFLKEWGNKLATGQLAQKIKTNHGLRRGLIGAAAVLAFIVLLVVLIPGGKSASGAMATYVVKRGPLTISVLESGNIEAKRAKELKSQVEGQTTIISIVPEGSYISEEDVKNGKVLVELDSSDLRDRRTQQEIQFQSSQASYTQARESFEIQKNQNESDIKQGELKVKFAKLELNKYLGAVLSGMVVEKDGVQEADDGTTETVDFAALGDHDSLGGDALQRKRKLEADIDLASEEVSRAEDKLKWTRELEAKGYVTRSELEADALSLKRREIELEQSRSALQLFLLYEFPKQVEKLLSDYQEAQRELERIKARARSQMAQKEADLKSKEAAYKLQEEKLKKLDEQIENCAMKAPQPGLVVYGSSGDYWRRRNDPIEEGASVRERQTIIQLPDTKEMTANVKVHESQMDKVKTGQKARILVDAFPDEVLFGEVTKIGVLPDAQRWINPDLKVYETEVKIEGQHDFLKPGLSTQVEIIIAELEDVLSVPVQAITTRAGKRVCYVLASSKPKMREVETGMSNDKFIEIKSGLEAGERVMLHPPELPAGEKQVTAEEEERAARETATRKRQTDTAKPQDTVSSPTVTETQAPEETPSEEAETVDIDKLLERVPAEHREAIKKRWESMSEAERQQMLRQFRQMQRRGRQGRPPQGRTQPPGPQ